jgi:branched-chain amino acid transport system permease protein
MVAGAAFSAFIEYFFLRPLLKRSGDKGHEIFLPIIATLGLLGVIKAILSFIYGDRIGSIPPPGPNDCANSGFPTYKFRTLFTSRFICA